ncbi:MAG: hypothetical protein A4E50_02038 [Methanosaeta sp. PtaB.Bin087]|nr:MAG: hypothetical protein A4E50_02038 [Methanosaeta sp. PtaB.Bin087]OPY56657.1 MAG: hypothetical protein A4E51_00348 [Methanosaeta sp. PtaU1.Bin055]
MWNGRWSGLDRDLVFLKHILDEAEFLMKNYQHIELQDLLEDEVLQRACLRSLEVIGEATKNLSNEFKAGHPEIEWRKIAGMRDKLVHHYFGVDWEVVWIVLVEKIPSLREDFKGLIEELKCRDSDRT